MEAANSRPSFLLDELCQPNGIDFEFDKESRVKEIFQNVFEDLFLSNSNRPLNFDQVKQALMKQMENDLTDDEFLVIEDMFKAADVDNDGTLSKRELKDLIGDSLEKEMFTKFF